jgi:hypothetical protein
VTVDNLAIINRIHERALNRREAAQNYPVTCSR